jgi:hypothetical protein
VHKVLQNSFRFYFSYLDTRILAPKNKKKRTRAKGNNSNSRMRETRRAKNVKSEPMKYLKNSKGVQFVDLPKNKTQRQRGEIIK